LGPMRYWRAVQHAMQIACVRILLCAAVLCSGARLLWAQSTSPSVTPQQTVSAQSALPAAPQPSPGIIHGSVTDTDGAYIPGCKLTLEDPSTHHDLDVVTSDAQGQFTFNGVPPGSYTVRFRAAGFSAWKVENVRLDPASEITIPVVELGVEQIDSTVNAIFSEDLAEQQITAEEHQRILGILPNFFVSYVHDAQPLTRRQKFKLAVIVSTDPLTYLTTGITAGFEQAHMARASAATGSAMPRPTATVSARPSSAQQFFLHCCIRIPVTSILATAPCSIERSTPSPRWSSAAATTATGSPTTPMSEETSPPATSPGFTTQDRTSTARR
jgi:hypothetical protein